MGNEITTNKKLDLVRPLSQAQRKQRLLDGYIRSAKQLRKMIPKDIKSIIHDYLDSMDDIVSNTELIQKKRYINTTRMEKV